MFTYIITYAGNYQEIDKRVGPNNALKVFSEFNKICYTNIRQVRVLIFWYLRLARGHSIFQTCFLDYYILKLLPIMFF